MQRFLKKIGCGKSPEPPEHSTPLKEPTSITARPPDLRVEPGVIPDGEQPLLPGSRRRLH